MMSLIQMMSKAHYVQLIGDYFMKEFLKKYGSRKFIIAMLTNILFVAVLLSEYGGKVGLIGSIVAIIVNSAFYIVNERKIDVEAVQKMIQLTVDDYKQIKELIDKYDDDDIEENNVE